MGFARHPVDSVLHVCDMKHIMIYEILFVILRFLRESDLAYSLG